MRTKIPIVFLVSAFLSALLAPHAEAVPTVPATGLEVQITESGNISLSAGRARAGGPHAWLDLPDITRCKSAFNVSRTLEGDRTAGDLMPCLPAGLP